MALAANALTTLDALASELGITITPSSDEETRAFRFINAASAMLEKAAGRVFYRREAQVEMLSGEGSAYMLTPDMPINDIGSISYLGSTVPTTAYEIRDSDAGVIFHVAGGWLDTSTQHNDISGTRKSGISRKSYTVTYDVGWFTPKQEDDDGADTRALPYDIEEACILVSVYLWRNRGRDSSIVSEKLLRGSQAYGSVADIEGADAMMGFLRAKVPMAAAIIESYDMSGLR